jgi:hypothetical protein
MREGEHDGLFIGGRALERWFVRVMVTYKLWHGHDMGTKVVATCVGYFSVT